MDDMEVYLLPTLRGRLQEILHVVGYDKPELYSSQNLKRQLAKEWPDLSFIFQHGMPDMVCSSSISVGAALSKAHDLAKLLTSIHDDSTENEPQQTDDLSEDTIVHNAIGILRCRILQTKKLDGEYYSVFSP